MESNKLLILFGKWLDGWVEYVLVFPVLLLIGIYSVQSPLYLMLSLPFLVVLGVFFRWFVENKKRIVYISFSLVISALSSFLMAHGPLHWSLIFLMSFVSLYRGIYFGSKQEDHVQSKGSYWLVGFPIYFFTYFFFRFIKSLHPYLLVITMAGILMVMTTLIIGNRELLMTSSLSKQKKPLVSRTIKSQNLVIILVSLLLIGIFSAFQTIKQAFLQVISGLIKGLLWLMSRLGSHQKAHETIQPAKTPMALKPGEPSKLALLLDKIAHIIFYIGLILAGIWLIYYISKKLGKWIIVGYRWLKDKLNKLFGLSGLKNEDDLQYYDEKSSLINFKKWRQAREDQAKDTLRHWFRRQPKWDNLDDQEKVRFAYRQVIQRHVKRGFSFHPSQTPSETMYDLSKMSDLPDKELRILSQVYNKVRYGDKTPGASELQKVSTLLNDSIKEETNN